MKRRGRGNNPADKPQHARNVEAYSSPTSHRSSSNASSVFMAFIFCVGMIATLGCWYVIAKHIDIWGILAAFVVAFIIASAIRVANQWETVVVLRFGKFARTHGPGLFFILPFIEHIGLRADQRTMLTGFGAEETLTLDLVPVNVDAIVYWVVWNAEKACTEVEDYYDAVSMVAQTTLRDAIGRKSLSKLIMQREQLDSELKEIIEEKVSGWGISIIEVEVRDVVIPRELQVSMAAEAIAEREREARMELVEVEKDIASMLHEASDLYRDDDIAFQLRRMHLLNESVRNSKGSLVVPSSYAEGFTDKTGGANQ